MFIVNFTRFSPEDFKDPLKQAIIFSIQNISTISDLEKINESTYLLMEILKRIV